LDLDDPPLNEPLDNQSLHTYMQQQMALLPPLGSGAVSASTATALSNVPNPPVLLQCGHCISYQAMDKIVKTLRLTRRFKCPTCPKEQAPSEVLFIHF
jgi:hypothetical protein